MQIKNLVDLVVLIKQAAEENTAVLVLGILFAIAFVLTAFFKLIDVLLKSYEVLRSLFSQMGDKLRGGKKLRQSVGRRRQFLNVLSSDLATIGKAEAWNDQNFTDLEAEVQIEGGYYASLFDRLRKRKSFSQRREPSLIGAIDGSTERCLLLTGDPGAGKSVALRHLAVQMIDRALRSKRKYVPVPLYINLRELSRENVVDSLAIKQFVIDNVRRGDADTAEYVQSHWDEFNSNGGWFFLFDSFDEIPEVLHSAHDDAVIDRYGRMIQQFMDGLGGCRGVLASREYKSPKTIAWPKLRILPLSELHQQELVSRTFLTDDQKQVALRALSDSQSSTYRNPLFLTLLCRFVRQSGVSPKNEHELLYAHVSSLTNRDSEYVQKKWGYTPRELSIAASELARLFALSPDLGLSPTLDEIEKESKRLKILERGMDSVLEALTYVKILRSDVASGSSSERRFAFSHRRYHEAIFARHLAEHAGVVPNGELFSNPRWREFLVAMLQSSSLEARPDLLESMVALLRECIARAKYFEERIAGYQVRGMYWTDPLFEHLLKIFVEVKRFNPSSAWSPIEEMVESVYVPLWARGDLYDRLKIISYGGAGESVAHSRRLDFVINSGVAALEEQAVLSCQFATSPSGEAAEWVRRKVAMRIISSTKKFDRIKWDALGSQLPNEYEMSICLKRANVIACGPWAWLIVRNPIARVLRRLGYEYTNEKEHENIKVWANAVYLMPVLVMVGSFTELGKSMGGIVEAVKNHVFIVSLCILFLLLAHAAISIVRLEFVSHPKRLSVSIILTRLGGRLRSFLKGCLVSTVVIVVLSLPALLIVWLFRKAGLFSAITDSSLFAFAWIGFLLAMILFFGFLGYSLSKKENARAEKILIERKSLRSAISEAGSSLEILALCRTAVTKVGSSELKVRRAITLLTERLLRRGSRDRPKSESLEALAEAISLLLYLEDGASALNEIRGNSRKAG